MCLFVTESNASEEAARVMGRMTKFNGISFYWFQPNTAKQVDSESFEIFWSDASTDEKNRYNRLKIWTNNQNI